MPKKIKKVLLALAATLVVLVVVFVAIVALQPSDFRIVRTAKMTAPPEAAFVQVNDFHNWEGWSPWAKLDPASKTVFEGPAEGKDAIFKWAGNNKVGEGSMTILESRPSELIRIKLEFLKPFVATNTAEFTFKAEGDQTAVTWSMTGRNNFIGRAICMFMNMDKTVGGEFEEGLANMKLVVERPPQK